MRSDAVGLSFGVSVTAPVTARRYPSSVLTKTLRVVRDAAMTKDLTGPLPEPRLLGQPGRAPTPAVGIAIQNLRYE